MAAPQAGASRPSKTAAPSEVQDAQRRTAKARRRGSKGNGAPSTTLFDGIAADRRERREQKQQAYRTRFFSDVWYHLAAAAQRYNWTADEMDEAHSYLTNLVFMDEQYSCMFKHVESEVQRRFALGCARSPKMTGMFGQSQGWYPKVLESAQAFWNRPKGTSKSKVPQRELQTA